MNRNKVQDFEPDHFGLPKQTAGGGGGGGKLTVRGVRITARESSVPALTWTLPPQSYVDGDASMFDASDNAFVAPEDGVYAVTARITDTIVQMESVAAVFKGRIDNPNAIAFSYKNAMTITGVPPIASAVVRLNRGDKLYCAIVTTKDFSIQPSSGFYSEFYLLGGEGQPEPQNMEF